MARTPSSFPVAAQGALLKAIFNGDLAKATRAVAQGADINFAPPYICATPLTALSQLSDEQALPLCEWMQTQNPNLVDAFCRNPKLLQSMQTHGAPQAADLLWQVLGQAQNRAALWQQCRSLNSKQLADPGAGRHAPAGEIAACWTLECLRRGQHAEEAITQRRAMGLDHPEDLWAACSSLLKYPAQYQSILIQVSAVSPIPPYLLLSKMQLWAAEAISEWALEELERVAALAVAQGKRGCAEEDQLRGLMHKLWDGKSHSKSSNGENWQGGEGAFERWCCAIAARPSLRNAFLKLPWRALSLMTQEERALEIWDKHIGGPLLKWIDSAGGWETLSEGGNLALLQQALEMASPEPEAVAHAAATLAARWPEKSIGAALTAFEERWDEKIDEAIHNHMARRLTRRGLSQEAAAMGQRWQRRALERKVSPGAQAPKLRL